jgi:hypothetical protein
MVNSAGGGDQIWERGLAVDEDFSSLLNLILCKIVDRTEQAPK